MPNHVHLVIDVWTTPLSEILGSWKGRTARFANELLDRSGRFWQRESFDTVVRDADDLRRLIEYTEHNPVKAGLVRDPKDWFWSSARLRDFYGRLGS
jgi:REP element-mobilizing transposase RayT